MGFYFKENVRYNNRVFGGFRIIIKLLVFYETLVVFLVFTFVGDCVRGFF